MRLIAKFLLVIVSVSGIAFLFHSWSSHKGLEGVQSTPLKESSAYTNIVENALKSPDLQMWPGQYQSVSELKTDVLEYKMNLATDRRFELTVASFSNKNDWQKGKSQVLKKLSGTYRVKGHVIFFENLQGHTGLMSDRARSAVEEWTSAGITFKNEDSVMRFRKLDDSSKRRTAG